MPSRLGRAVRAYAAPLLILETFVLAFLAVALAQHVAWLAWRSTVLPHPYVCVPDGEGKWSIGIFRGPSPFDLQPLESAPSGQLPGRPYVTANPVLTCAHVHDVTSTFVADPFIVLRDNGKTVHLFYETKSHHNKQGDIGTAISSDGGATFQHVGIALDEDWHLSYPFIVEDGGETYMVPEGSGSGRLTLYRALAFPLKWTVEKVLIDAPLIDSSLFKHGNRWYLFASNRREKSSKNCRELEVWSSDSLLGEWVRHPQSPVRSWKQGSRPAGRPIVYNGQLYRFGQDCAVTYGHRVRAFRVDHLDTERYAETEVPFSVNGPLRPGVDWNGLRQHHLDAHQLSDGSWIAAMDGDSVESDHLSWAAAASAVRCAVAAVVAVVVALLAQAVLPRVSAWRLGGRGRPHSGDAKSKEEDSDGGAPGARDGRFTGSEEPPGVSDEHGGAGSTVRALQKRREPRSNTKGDAMESGHARAAGGGCAGGELPATHLPATGALLSTAHDTRQRRRELSRTRTHTLLLAVVACLSLWFLAATWPYWRANLLPAIMWYVRTWGPTPGPVMVNGSFSKFSVVVQSFEARRVTLAAFVSHYSRCASVGEIVVVWNKGVPPVPRDEWDYPPGMPVRVRAEALNSMNNRFQPDAALLYRAVLMLDDDIMMPCADIERGFQTWRQHPERVAGYYSRLLEGDPPQYQCLTQCEKYTYTSGRFNVVLSGAAFMDSQRVFADYFSDMNADGRAYVDRVFNCDDLLMNYVLAATMHGQQWGEYVRPSMRLDVGKLTSKRLSTGNFGPVRHACTRAFATMFGNPLLNRSFPLDFGPLGRPACGPAWLGCAFIGFGI
ncbi:hypothetical protein FOA52_011349 [Chlamydomonas sp. UWO 241]|nr:hypothetical protein FOA52_011349 [Chlamydomonas sp. UWO 241]